MIDGKRLSLVNIRRGKVTMDRWVDLFVVGIVEEGSRGKRIHQDQIIVFSVFDFYLSFEFLLLSIL